VPSIPDPARASVPGMDNKVVFLKPLITSELIEVGEFTYYADPVDASRFEAENVMYNFGPERLVIGKFCAIGTGTKILMPASSHPAGGVSTYPFFMFAGSWMDATLDGFLSAERLGDTVIGNDVWFGREATIMPGVRIGDGAIVGTGAVVTSDVPPYGIVFGNPARLVSRRFGEEDVARLLRVAWWDWPVETITAYAGVIAGGKPAELEAVAIAEGLVPASADTGVLAGSHV
jgi:virginiamycin A acetyltransferase